jgi:hypothetical protein
MDNRVQNWLEANIGKSFSSPRNQAFNKQTKDFEIVSISSDRVNIRFVGSKYPALPLAFSMFDRVLNYLSLNKGRPVRLGAKVSPPYENDTLEGEIWRCPYPMWNTPYKVSPHVCDILALAGLVKYISIINRPTGRKVECAELINSS